MDTNWSGFQPLGCGSICTQGFALGWYRSAPLALEYLSIGARRWRLSIGARRWRLRPSAGCGFLGSVTTSAFLKLTHYPTPLLFCRIGRTFSPWAVALSSARDLPWAGIGARRWRFSVGARRWRLRSSAGCGFLASVTTSAFSQTDPLPKGANAVLDFLRCYQSVPSRPGWEPLSFRR